MPHITKLFSKIVFLTLCLVSTSVWATIVLTPADCNIGVNCWTSPENKQPTAEIVANLVGTSTDLLMLYKSDQDNAQGSVDSGLAAAWYDTTYSNSSTDPQDALIEWLGGPSLSCSECYLSIKDGNNNPSLYIFDISFWDGQMDIDMNDFWPTQGAISNVAIWGPATSVTEPVTLALLGLGLFGVASARNRHRRLM